MLAGQVFEAADGFIASLILQNYSNREIRALLGIGGHRVCRVRAELRNPELRLKGAAPQTNSMAFTEEDINQIKTNAKDWELQDGFACSHRR